MNEQDNQDAQAPGHDSFLDVVANMVGILIILVMVVGMRVKNAPPAAVPGRAALADPELQEDRATEASVRDEVLRLAERIRNVQAETLTQSRRRDFLAATVATLQEEIRARREQMDAEARENFDLRRALSEAKARLQQLERELHQAQVVQREPIRIESYPTPLSQTVEGEEVHFQLRGGQIVVIPLEPLIAELKQDALRQKYRLLDLPELTDTVGPIGGFRLRYTFERYDVPPDIAAETGRGGSFARLKQWTLIPVSSQLGEPPEMALAEGSEFRKALSKLQPGRATITIWTYPDSFAAFRKIKKELYHLGFAVAARPLPHGTPIRGSPEGSKSAAE